MFNQFLLCVIGLAGGLVVSGGVFTALIVIGLIPRFAGKTHTASQVFRYENAAVAGCIAGCFLSTLPISDMLRKLSWIKLFLESFTWMILSQLGIVLYGSFAGIFVGCLALAIAEMLNSIPIFARRIGFRKGLSAVVIAMAFGKMIGSILYFGYRFYF